MMSEIIVIFTTVFLAELGDKTQLATLLFAAERESSPLLVFAAASGALVLSTGLAVALGIAAERWLAVLPLKLLAGLGFVAIGLWTLWDYWKGATAA